MIELPECLTLARQMNELLKGLRVLEARAGASPHGFAFYTGSPERYAEALRGRVFSEARAFGGILEVGLGGLMLLFSDGANLRLYPSGTEHPAKHQLLLRFDNGAVLLCTVQMYAGIHLCEEGTYHSAYHRAAREKLSPFQDGFSLDYFRALAAEGPRLSAKAFLATQQRFPGLGNGVLQDILFRARIHPRTRVSMLGSAALAGLYHELRNTLRQMAELGGRDTEKDLYGRPGGYQTLMSRTALDRPCPGCFGVVTRESYMGGNVYYCPACQPFIKA